MAERAPTRRVLFESLGISLVDFRCHAHVEPLGPEEPNATHSIALIRRGVFGRSHESETVVADPNHVLFFNAGQPYRYAHPVPGGDDCTVLAVATPCALELAARHGQPDGRPEAPFRIGHGLCSKRAARLHWELLALLKRPMWMVPRLMIEDGLAELADEAIGSACRRGEPAACGATPSARVLRQRRERIEAAQVALSRRLEAPPTLVELAGSLGCSPFQLSRTFHATLGLSLRRYLKRLRARVAADRLAAGVRDLTGLALDLGYADHSHFTNSFRQEWGVPPSRFRAECSADRDPTSRSPGAPFGSTARKPTLQRD